MFLAFRSKLGKKWLKIAKNEVFQPYDVSKRFLNMFLTFLETTKHVCKILKKKTFFFTFFHKKMAKKTTRISFVFGF